MAYKSMLTILTEAEQAGPVLDAAIAAADYVGVISLAKGFGDQAVYHLRKL